jgi:hypothetical protein
VSIINIIDISFFRVLIIDGDYLIKEWYLFGRKSIKLSSLKASSIDRLWKGSIVFGDKNKSVLQTFYMNFETFPCEDRGYDHIKKALIRNGVINEDEACWSNSRIKEKNIWQKIFTIVRAKKSN